MPVQTIQTEETPVIVAGNRTFEQIVLGEFSGNVAACCRALKLDRVTRDCLRHLFQGRATRESVRLVLRRVAAAVVDGNVDTLFPQTLYRSGPLFMSVYDTPGYQAIARAYDLTRRTGEAAPSMPFSCICVSAPRISGTSTDYCRVITRSCSTVHSARESRQLCVSLFSSSSRHRCTNTMTV